MIGFRRTLCLMVVLLLAGCGEGGLFGAGGLFGPAPPPGPGLALNPGPSDEYVIGPGDQLSVFVYDSPQLGAEVPVRPDGRISTPLIQDIVAAGKTPVQLGREMTEKLKEYVKDPQVTIIVRGFVGPFDRQIRVIGEAADPIAIPYRDQLTVLDVMIATKGLTRYAAGNRAIIVRRVHDKAAAMADAKPGDVKLAAAKTGAPAAADRQEVIHVRLSDLMKDGDISQNVAMQPGDTLIIPQTWF